LGTTPLVKRIITIAIWIAVAVFLYIYFSQLLPVFLALLTALIFEPFVRWFKGKMKLKRRIIPVSIVFVLFLCLFALLIYITFTRVMDSIYYFSMQVPGYMIQIQQFINELIIQINGLLAEIPYGDVITSEIESQSNSIMDAAFNLTTYLIGTLISWIQSIPNLVFVSIFYFMMVFLFSLDLPRLKKIFYNFFRSRVAEQLQYANQRMGQVFLGYWKAQFILSVGVFILTYFSLRWIAPSAALIMSTIIWIVDIIPLYIGPVLILLPWGILAMLIGDIVTGIQLLLLAVVITVLRRIIEPKVLGDSMGMGALPTVLSMYLGFVFGGVIGMILGPFVYMALVIAREANLFELLFSKNEEEKVEKAPT
jgi:sporulation integral membrane protein YtvI